MSVAAHIPRSRRILVHGYFAVTSGADRRTILRALSDLGFRQQRRVFVHPQTVYTLDFVADSPHIDVAAFLHWSDSESLDVAERAISAPRARPSNLGPHWRLAVETGHERAG